MVEDRGVRPVPTDPQWSQEIRDISNTTENRQAPLLLPRPPIRRQADTGEQDPVERTRLASKQTATELREGGRGCGGAPTSEPEILKIM